MEITRWVYYAVVSCALVSCIVAKTVSLNELIEAESNQIETTVHATTPTKIEDPEPAGVRFSLNKGLKPLNRLSKKYKETGTKQNFIPLGKRISPLQYRKTFQIKSPLKPKRVKYSLRTRHKRKNQSIKREIDDHALLNQKYIPLLKSLGMLFDNILGTESSESIEETKHKRKRLRYILEGDDDISCQCPRKNEQNAASFSSEEETVISTTAVAPEVPVTTETPTTTTDYTSVGDFHDFRHHPNVPLLLPRNTTSTRRDHHGFGERSRTTHNGSPERYISRDHGDHEYTSEWGQERSNAESYEDNTNSASRNDASSAGTRGKYVRVRDRELGSSTKEIHEDDAVIKKGKTKKFLEVGKDSSQFDGTNKLKNTRDKAKSGKLLSKSVRRQRGSTTKDRVVNSAESLQPKDYNKEGIVNVTYDSSSDQRFTNGNGSYSTEDQKVNAGVETMINTVFTTLKPIENIITEDEKKVISESAQSDEYYGYENDFNVNIGNNITDDEINSESITSNTTQELEVNSEFDITSKKDSQENVQYKEKLELKSLSTEIYDSIKDKANMEYVISDELQKSDEDTNKGKSEEVPKTELKPPVVEIPISFSTASRTRSKGPTVMIFDGYSVTRHKNGENKLAEKAIRIRP